MATLTLQLPENALAAMRYDPHKFAKEMRLAAAAMWYEQERISQEIAAQIAGMNRTEFLLSLAALQKDSFQVDFDDLDRELNRG